MRLTWLGRVRIAEARRDYADRTRGERTDALETRSRS